MVKRTIPEIFLLLPLCFWQTATLWAQDCRIQGRVQGLANQEKATVFILKSGLKTETDSLGRFVLQGLPCAEVTLKIWCQGKKSIVTTINASSTTQEISFSLEEMEGELDEVEISLERMPTFGISRLKAIEGTSIYEGKKTEVVVMRDITANLSTNNPRQIYSKITGLHIWESDAMGLQLGVGGRGLSPNRTSNFNTRQNGYDISADALGYPESYYTPPAEALERIEVVRGAASLQYGTQFGGMLNFVLKKAPKEACVEVISRQTVGSFGYLGTFNSIGTRLGKWNLFVYSQYKRGDGWRLNSNFYATSNFITAGYEWNEHTKINIEYTLMHYQAKQPGGLTDAAFAQNARQSFRSRNWFEVNWHLAALHFDHAFSHRSKLNVRTFGLLADRGALGNLERINVADFRDNRTLILGKFRNAGQEGRWLYEYEWRGKAHQSLVGYRLYRGYTRNMQGEGDRGQGPVFTYLNPDNLENSDFRFPNFNAALFSEQIININNRLAIVPGIRLEHIETGSAGYYKLRVNDAAGNIVAEQRIEDARHRHRTFPIFGIGTRYTLAPNMQLYANYSQNYRAINFSDLRIVNPNLIVDTLIKDETGFTADIGIRGESAGLFTYEATLFYLKYNGRIGQVLRADRPPLFIDYRYRTNIADARNVGLELLGELNLLPLITGEVLNQKRLSVFVNTSVIDARYINTQEPGIRNRKVEMVPPVMFRSGLSGRVGKFSGTVQVLYAATHYSDATNAIRTSTAVEGEIPAYTVWDASVAYKLRRWNIEASCNNLLNARYFTRRAEGYPGPGIISADARSLFVTLGYQFCSK
jgi:Fe(3+) dicitrate transport protein